MRVLHLIDVTAPWGGPCTQRLAAQVIGRIKRPPWTDHDVLLIGTHADVHTAAECGLRAIGSIWPLGGKALSAARALRRWLISAAKADRAPDVIHSWSASSGALAAVAAGNSSRVVTLKPLAVDVVEHTMTIRADVRSRWRASDDVKENEFVLGLLGEPACCFDARRAMHVGARTGLSSRRIRVIMSGRSVGRAAQEAFLSMLDLDRVVVQDGRMTRPWEVLRGLDAGLVLAPVERRSCRRHGPLSSLPVLIAQAAGVPIIAEQTAPHDGLVEHDHTGLLFPGNDLNAACDRLARLHDDQTLAGRLTANARAQIDQRFTLDRLCEQLQDAWHRAVEHNREIYLE